MEASLTGVGLYTVPQAAAISGATQQEVRRWLFGYDFGSKSAKSHSPPLWETQLRDRDELAIGFNDLLELRIVKTFVRNGVHLLVIRRALENARVQFRNSHPLVNQRFLTDGRSVFAEAAAAIADDPNEVLIDLAKSQLVFRTIIRPTLFAGIEFGSNGVAARWFPLGRKRSVVLDPERSFGRPILTRYGVPVDAIKTAILAEKSKSIVARIFDIPIAAVSEAEEFEIRLAA